MSTAALVTEMTSKVIWPFTVVPGRSCIWFNSVGLCPEDWVCLYVQWIVWFFVCVCVCVNFLCCDFLDYVNLNITVTDVNFPKKMPITFAPWMSMYIKIKQSICIDFIPSEHPLTWKTNPIIPREMFTGFLLICIKFFIVSAGSSLLRRLFSACREPGELSSFGV